MPRTFTLEGQQFHFPDDTTDDEALEFLTVQKAPPSMGAVIASTPGTAKRQLLGAMAGVHRAAGDVLDVPEWQKEAAGVTRELKAEEQLERPPNMTLLQEGVQSGLSSVMAMAPAAAIAAPLGATGAALSLGTTIMGGQTGFQRYGDLRTEGFSGPRSALHGAFEGLVEKYTEYLPMKQLVTGLKGHLMSFLWRDMTGEQIATLLQDVSAKLSDRPDMTLGEYIHDAMVTAIATPIAAGTQMGAVGGVRALAQAATPGAAPTTTPPVPAEPPPSPLPTPPAPTASTPPGQPTVLPLPTVAEPNVLAEPATLPVPPAVGQGTPLVGGEPTGALPEAQTPFPALNTGLAGEGVVGAPPPMVVVQGTGELPAGSGSIRVYTDLATQGDGKTLLVSENPIQQPQGDVAYADISQSQLDTLKAGVPETARLAADAPGVHVISNVSDISWQISQPVREIALKVAPVLPSQTPEVGETTLIAAPTAKVTFPTKVEGALWRLGTALARADTVQGTVDSKRLRELTKAVQTELKLSTPLEATSAANEYFRGSLELGVHEQAKKGEISAPPREVAVEAARMKRRLFTRDAAGIPPGKVRAREGVEDTLWTQRMAGYLQAWVKLYSPQMRVVIAGTSSGSGADFASTWFDEGVHYVITPPATRKGVQRGTHQTMALLALAHEFGHMLITEHINNPKLARQRDALVREFTRQLAAAKNLTVEQFVEASGTPQDLFKMETRGGKLFGQPPTAPAEAMFAKAKEIAGYEYINNFDEWAAEQFVRHTNHNRYTLQVPELEGFWQPLMQTMKEFFDKIVKRFAPSKQYSRWLEELQALPAMEAALTTQNPAPTVHKAITQEPVDRFNYTTRVLDRLPKKDVIKKVTIYGELGRADVRKQERELIGRVLKEFPGESVDSKAFKERVLGSLVVLDLHVSFNDRYVDYGLNRIGLGDRNYSPTSPAVHVWTDPSSDYASPHFPSVPGYWAHTRRVDGLIPFPSDVIGAKQRTLVEIQSDLEQRGTVSETTRTTRLMNMEGELQELKDEWRNLRERGQYDTQLYRTADEADVDLGTQITLREAEIDKLRQAVQRNEVLPRKWHELVLLHEHRLAAKDGVKTLRLVGPNSLPKVEGWNEFRFYPGLVGVPVAQSVTRGATANGWVTGNHVYYNAPGINPMAGAFQSVAPPAAGTLLMNPQSLTLLAGEAYEVHYNPEAQAVLDHYKREIWPFVQKEFGAKLVTEYTDRDGVELDFYEWPVTELERTLPIRYYSLVQAVDETGGKVVAGTKVPELSPGFEKVQGWLQNLLQLNQLAKLLPQVPGLQLYRRFMQDLHALKARMLVGPNERVKEWHALGYKQALKVEHALREEQAGGEHWVPPVAITVPGVPKPVWVFQPTEGWEKLMDQRGISREGRDLFLGVKNDFLSTLQMMEDVVEKNINEFFTDNELARASRMADARAEFDKLRATPYLPDMRFGNWSVQIRAGYEQMVEGRLVKKGELVYWEKFRRKGQRDRKFAELMKQYGQEHVVSRSYDDDTVAPLRGFPQSFVDVLVETMNSSEDTKLTPEQMAGIKDIAFDQTAAGKFAKYLKTPKKAIGGASKDLQRAYATYHWKSANQVAKLRYFRSLQQGINMLKGNANALRATPGGDSDSYDKLVAYVRKNFNYVMQPQSEYENLRSLVSLWYLWGSAKTAVMNLMSVPVLTFPYLWSRYGILDSQAALLRAMKDVTMYWRNPEKLSPDRQKVLQKFKDDGVTDQSYAAMLATVADGGVAFERMVPQWEFLGGEMSYATRQLFWKVTSLGMLPFRVVEQFNRQITGLAAYDLESKRLGRTLSSGDNAAYQFARDSVDYTQNEYGPWNRPPLMQGKQSILLLFFSFVQNMSFMMFGGDKSWWRAIMVLAALAGVQGLPGMDNLIDMMNWVLRKTTGEYVDLRVEAREMAQQIGLNPDLVMHGISHSWGIGLDTSSSIGQGRLIPGTEAVFGIGRFEDRFLSAASDVGGPVGALFVSFLQAAADDNPNAFLIWDRMLPPVLRNIERTINAKQMDAFVNSRGRPLVSDPTELELFGQALGFSPTRKTEAQEVLHTAKDAAMYYQLRRQNLMETLYAARKTRDSDAIAEARAKISRFNQDVPSPKLKIRGEDITRAMETRKRMDQESSQLRSPSRRYQDLYSQIAAAYPGQ